MAFEERLHLGELCRKIESKSIYSMAQCWFLCSLRIRHFQLQNWQDRKYW